MEGFDVLVGLDPSEEDCKCIAYENRCTRSCIHYMLLREVGVNVWGRGDVRV